MPILRAVCPECRAGMKSGNPAGFALGQTVECPKCGTYFAVEEAPPAAKAVAAKPRPAEDAEDDDRPAKKKARRDAEDDEDDDRPAQKKKGKKSKGNEKSYKSSPVRFIILGVLVVIMLVGGFFLYQKIQKEKEDANTPAPVSNPDDDLGKPIRPDPNAKQGGRK